MLEKDLQDARIRSSTGFIVHTNHDTESLGSPADITHDATGKALTISGLMDDLGMAEFLDDSKERRRCVQERWSALKVRQWRKQRLSGIKQKDMVSPCVAEKTLITWVQKYPTMNEQSHFGCVMDPRAGMMVWIERGEYEEDGVSVNDTE